MAQRLRMDERSSESRYSVGDAPVNLRTARRKLVQLGAHAPALTPHLQRLHARHALGPALADALVAPEAASRAPVPALAIAGVLVGTALLVTAALANAPVLRWGAVGVAVVALTSAGWGVRRARHHHAATLGEAATPPTLSFDPQVLHTLDRLIDEAVPALDADTVEPLRQLKTSIVRVVEARRTAPAPSLVTTEDDLYLHECLRRYLPDALQAYLRVPAPQRHVPPAVGPTAAQLLCNQLALMQSELDQQEARWAEQAREALVRQQQFLLAKKRSRL